MTTRPAPRTLLTAAFAVAVALPFAAVGCGGSSGGDEAASTTVAATADPTTTPAEEPAPTETTAPTVTTEPVEEVADAPCRTTGELTGRAEATWTDAPTELIADNAGEPIGASSPTQFKVDDGRSILSVFAAGPGPAAAKVTVLTGSAGTGSFLTDDVTGTITADGAEVDTDLALGAQEGAVHLTVTITCG